MTYLRVLALLVGAVVGDLSIRWWQARPAEFQPRYGHFVWCDTVEYADTAITGHALLYDHCDIEMRVFGPSRYVCHPGGGVTVWDDEPASNAAGAALREERCRRSATE